MKYLKFMANLYHYSENNKKEISGFSKFEVEGNTVRINLKLCFLKYSYGVIKIYILNKKNGMICADKLKEDKMRQRVYTMQRIFNLDELKNMNINVETIKGVYINFAGERIYMSLFENDDINISDIKISDNIKDDMGKIIRQSEELSRGNKVNRSEVKVEENDVNRSEVEAKENNVNSTEVEVKENDVNITDVKAGGFEKTDLIMLKSLPKKAWALGNNSFLLHGYYNYHHIAVKKEDNCWIIGVPGIYHPKEEKAASFFGFKSFCPAINEEINNNVFGYWCMSVETSE